MSDLIVLPSEPTAFDGPLEGRVLMLNTAVKPRFQCYGFSVTRNSPIQIVPKFAQEFPLRQALQEKVLLDVTGTEAAGGGVGKVVADIEKAIKSKVLDPVKEGEEIGPRVLVGTDAQGNSYMITPKDEADYQRMMLEIQTTGTLRIEKPKAKTPTDSPFFTGLSAITVEDLPELETPPGE
jgi:hypothetical protein